MKNLILIIALAFGMMVNAQQMSIEELANITAGDSPSAWISTDRIPAGGIIGTDAFISIGEPESKILKYEQKNDTLYVYIRERHTTYVGCIVGGCTDDHMEIVNYRLPFYAKDGKVEKGERQTPKVIEIKKEVVEYKEEW